jgi:hypothetical protein
MHEIDFLLLLDDDSLSEPTQNGIAAELQLSLGHVDRTLMMRDHHGCEVPVGVSGMRDRHVLGHAIHRLCHGVREGRVGPPCRYWFMRCRSDMFVRGLGDARPHKQQREGEVWK